MSLERHLQQSVETLLKNLSLPIFARNYHDLAQAYEKQERSYVDYLKELSLKETEYRYQQRINRLLKQAKLPRNKILQDFEINRIPCLSPTQIQTLAKGDFIDRYENLLIFGNPGTGKTHLSIALAREWCLLGRKVYYTTASSLVQHLLQAKSHLQLEQFIKKMDRFEIVLIDDISYVPYERHETDVLFTLLAARYEMRSIVITSNLPFAQWNTIFKDEMTTTAAIDRLVHHSTILELNAESYRIATAKKQTKKSSEKKSKEENHVN